MDKLNKDYSYCSGVACPLRENCKRYLPDPPDIKLWWIPPAFKDKTKDCPYLDPVKQPEYMDNSEFDYGHNVGNYHSEGDD